MPDDGLSVELLTSGSTLSVVDGLPPLKDANLNVRVQVEVPTKLNSSQQEKLRTFSESIGEQNSPMQESFFQKARRFFDL